MRKFMDILNEAIIDTNATPSQREAGDDAHYDARRKTGFFGAQAAGCILMAKTTGRIMLVLRSAEVDQPHTYGNLGGAHHSDERPIDAASREAHEETGYTGKVQMIPLMVFTKDAFRYSNFLGIVDEEFEPHLGWEADKAVWVELGHFPSPLHFGMKALFADAKSMNVIKHYAAMFRNGDDEHEVTEEVILPAGVDVDKAIAAGKDGVADLAKDIANGTMPAVTPAEADAAADDASSTTTGKPAPAASTTAPAANKAAPAPAPNAPPVKKSLAPIKPQ